MHTSNSFRHAASPLAPCTSPIRFSLRSLVLAITCSGIAAAQVGGAYQVTNLLSDGSVPATITDAKFLNPWAISASGTWWISTEASGYNYIISSTTTPTPPATYNKVTVPAASGGTTATGTPTGSVTTGGSPATALILSNGTKANFLFSTLDGTISGWNAPIGQTGTALIAINNSASGASYNGLALINSSATTSYILAPNFGTANTIEVYDTTFKATKLAGTFTDPTLPTGYSPYSVHVLNGQVFVAYAVRSATAPYHSVSGLGNGIVSVFDLSGNFVARAITGGQLNAPWGVAFAPTSFGIFGGDLLVGNFGDGHINAYDPKTYTFLGQLNDNTGKPLTYATLWDLLAAGTAVGNSTAVSGGTAGSVYFTAGLAGQAHGLFAAIANNPTPTGTPTFGLSTSNGTLTANDGAATPATIVSVAPTNNFSGTVTFACSGLPTSATCTFSPTQVTAVATAPISTMLTIQTIKTSALAKPYFHRTHAAGFALALLLPFGSILALYRRRFPSGSSPIRLFVFFGVTLLALGAITSCSSSSNLMINPTPTGTSTVTVTATSGSASQSTTLSLVVQ